MSTPLFQEIDPNVIPWQKSAIRYAFKEFNYDNGINEMLLSGSIGSAKSVCAAHIIVRHCIENNGARALILRRVLKDLKRTLWQTILAHMADIPNLIKDYNKSDMKITFINGSEIIGDSYDKGDLEKFRSLELSMLVIEEASESNSELYDAVKMRVGRLPKIKQNIILTLTNPDEPSHYLYKKIIAKDGTENKKVFYSLTEQNPFLPKWYIENLRRDLDPEMAKRMLQGMWISIQHKTPYYAYNTNKQFLRNIKYKFNPYLPVDLMHDFNIGQGKPMSAAIGQNVNGEFHIAKNFIIEGFDTNEIIQEIIQSNYIPKSSLVRVFGDASGQSRDTRSGTTDYDIIQKHLTKAGYQNELHVPSANPLIRDRQNIVNSYCMNDLGQTRLYIYKEAETVDEGLKLTKLKKGSTYQEDDSDAFQHVVTALGYYIYHYDNYNLMKTRQGIVLE